MRLKLTLRRGEDRRTDLTVTADATARVQDVAAMLFSADPDHAGAPAPDDATLHVAEPGSSGRVLDADLALLDAGLRSGSTVTVVQRSPQFAVPGEGRGPAVAVLRVLAGPDAGREFGLPSGASTVGRDRDVDVRLSDPLVSKRHVRLNVGAGVEVIDLGSANGVLLGGRAVSRVQVGPGDVLVLGETELAVVQIRQPAEGAPTTPDVAVNRGPRLVPRFEPRELPVPVPPGRTARQRFPLVAMLAPIVLGGVLFFTTSRSPASILVVAVSPLIAVGTYLDAIVTQRRERRAASAQFAAELEATRAEVARLHDQERASRLAEHPSLAEALEHAARLGPLLWTLRPEHEGFRSVRLGLGAVPSRTTLARQGQTKEGAPQDWARLDQLAADVALVADVPVVVDLRTAGNIGVAGGEPSGDVARGLVAQLVALRSPAELVLAAFVGPSSRAGWDWLTWLPHTSSPHSPLVGDHLAADAASAGSLVTRLEQVANDRAQADEEVTLPLVVVVVDEDAPVDRARLTRLAETGPAVGVHLVWHAAAPARLPAACRTYLEVSAAGVAVVDVEASQRVAPVAVELAAVADAERLGRTLSPVVDAGAPLDDDSDLPRAVSYLTMAGAELGDEPDAVVERWRQTGSLPAPDGTYPRRRTDAGLRALVGHAGSAPLHLDLRTDGPHALVGGTTGAGKSEFLQSWVLGMAAAYSPQRVTFLLVDYKGGSAFADCVGLPHTVGLVTDLSPHLVRRALTSLRAELRHREHILARKKAKDLLALERAGDPEAPPALVIVVDEFAALVSEVPEFVDGVVDVAQRGRSLGLHLILATQRPAGVIKDNLRANTNLRVALRMADADDSLDVLGIPDAAHIDPALPGRGVVRTGPRRATPFQTAYAGGWTTKEPPRPRIDVTEVAFGTGRAWEVPERAVAPTADPGPSDIARVVATIGAAARAAAVPVPRRPWLPVLAPAYDLGRLRQRTDEALALGVVDEPQNQLQQTVYYRPDVDGNLAVYGASGAGKSATLRTLALAAGITPRGGPVHVYGLDFGSRGLSMLEDLPHVGAVVPGDDGERVARLLRWLKALVDERAVRYAAIRAGSIVEYRALAGAPLEPRILVLVDGVAAFREAYDIGDNAALFVAFEQVAGDGRPVGVHVVLGADRPSAIPPALRSSVQRKLVLRLADDDDYGMLDVPSDVVGRGSPPGRGILDDLEVQVAVLGGSANVADQARAVASLARSVADRGDRLGAVAPVRSLPDDVPLASLPPVVGDRVALGLEDQTIGPWGLEPSGLFAVAGPPGSGRSTALATIAQAVRRARPGMRAVLLGPERSLLRGLPAWTATAGGPQAVANLVDTLDGPPALVVVEDLAALLGTPAEQALERALPRLLEHGHFVVAESEVSRLSQYGGLLQSVKAARRGIVLQPDQSDGDSLFRTAFPRLARRDFPPGRGLVAERGRVTRVQLARPV